MRWQFKKVLAIVIIITTVVLAPGCSGGLLDEYVIPTSTATVAPSPTATLAPGITQVVVHGGIVDILGDVYLRDETDETRGVLLAGTSVFAECDGRWCMVTAGQHTGLRFWRGCGSDNPEGLGCSSRQE